MDDELTPEQHGANVETVEAVVRRQMSKSLGGRRGMLEAGLPGAAFTIVWLVAQDLRASLIAGLVVAGVALVLRLIQRSTLQYVANAVIGIAIGWGVVHIARGMGGSQQDQALAFFLPGIIITGVYTIAMIISCVTRWPVIGFMVGSVAGDPLAWHEDAQVVTLCTRLTWLFLAPGGILVLLEGPVWFLGWSGAMSVNAAVLVLGILRMGVGWPLRLGAWGAMVWLLARNATPVEQQPTAD
jgi:hypothetical protein